LKVGRSNEWEGQPDGWIRTCRLRNSAPYARVTDMLRVMLDSCVFDRLLDDAEVHNKLYYSGVQSGQVAVMTTHIQRDELVATPDPEKRANLVSCWDLLTRTVTTVPTGMFVLGVSRLDQACLGEDEVFDQVLRTSAENTKDGLPGHTNDALIVHTALVQQATLVTLDRKRMMKVARAVGVHTWTIDEFFDRIRRGDFSSG